MKAQPWARVPIELLQLVDAPALQLYVAIVSHVSNGSDSCRPSNERLSELTQQSVATVKRSLTQLVDVGAIKRSGRRRRVLVVTNRLTSEPKDDAHQLTDEPMDEPNWLTSEPPYGSPVSRPTELDVSELDTHSLRSCDAATDESEPAMHDDTPPLFAVELPEQIEPEPVELPIGRAALAAFFESYGDAPISRPMIGRLGKRFKELGATYDRELVLRAAHEMGEQRVANPNACESFVLRLRTRAAEQQEQQSGWSRLATQAFASWEQHDAQSV